VTAGKARPQNLTGTRRTIALINSTFGGVSGSGRHVYNLARGLRTTYDFRPVANTRYIDVPKLRSASFYLLHRFLRIRADLIHIHNPKFSGLLRGDQKGILTVHGDFKTELRQQYGRL